MRNTDDNNLTSLGLFLDPQAQQNISAESSLSSSYSRSSSTSSISSSTTASPRSAADDDQEMLDDFKALNASAQYLILADSTDQVFNFLVLLADGINYNHAGQMINFNLKNTKIEVEYQPVSIGLRVQGTESLTFYAAQIMANTFANAPYPGS